MDCGICGKEYETKDGLIYYPVCECGKIENSVLYKQAMEMHKKL